MRVYNGFIFYRPVINLIYNSPVTETSTSKSPESITPSPRITVSLFFLLCALAGGLSLYGVLMLPPSESKNTFIAGFSLLRILTWTFHGLGIAFFLGMFIHSIRSKTWAVSLEKKVRDWNRRHPFLSSAYFCLSLAAILLLGGLDFLMDAQRFPRMEPYIFLYVRLRPILLWLLAVVVFFFILTLVHHWLRLSPRDFLPQSRLSRLAAGGLGIVLAANIAMWIDLLNDPIYFEDRSGFWMPVVYVSIPLLFTGLFLIDHQSRSKTE